jgi:hypothetical protein
MRHIVRSSNYCQMTRIIINLVLVIQILIACGLLIVFALTFFTSGLVSFYLKEFNAATSILAANAFNTGVIVCFLGVMGSKICRFERVTVDSKIMLALCGFLFVSGVIYVSDRCFDQSIRIEGKGDRLEVFDGNMWRSVEPGETDYMTRALSRRVTSSLLVSSLLITMVPVVLISRKIA